MVGDSLTQDGGDWSELRPGYTVKNRGVGYATSKMLLADLNQNLQKTTPKLVFVLAGINDIRLSHMPPEQILANLQDITRRIRAAGAIPVMQSALPTAGFLRETNTNQSIARLNALLAAWCKETGTEFVDLSAASRPTNLQCDAYRKAGE